MCGGPGSANPLTFSGDRNPDSTRRVGRHSRAMKPYVICHMMPSLDGRLRTDRWKVSEKAHEEYDRIADAYRAQAWLCGRTTMEEFSAGRWQRSSGRRGKAVPVEDWVGPKSAER